mmetsp:Transcript_29778/g.72567  ORF Transcript_29778/g.72567 Transcript_29778/m.72567 type:complete len:248 (+) Transcript_29778:410-1153(+)
MMRRRVKPLGPAKLRLVVVCGARPSIRLQPAVDALIRRHFTVDPSSGLRKGGKVRACHDGISWSPCDRRVLVIVPGHDRLHRFDRRRVGGKRLEQPGPHAPGVALHLTGDPPRSGVERDVVRGPVPLALQPGGLVGGLDQAGDLLEHPEGVVPQRLARPEPVQVEDHPLVVVGARVEPRERPGPPRRGLRQGVRGGRPDPAERRLWRQRRVGGAVVDVVGRLDDHEGGSRILDDIVVVDGHQKPGRA